MAEYIHNDEKVIYQTVQDQSFIDALNAEGIKPEELPDPEMSYRVFKYSKNGQKRYAIVQEAIGADTYAEKVFITFAVPEDSWKELMLDIIGQIEGEEPKQIESRLNKAIIEAEKAADEWITKRYGAAEIWENKHKQERDSMFKLFLSGNGYNYAMLNKISAPDTDIEYLKQILKE